MLLCRGTAKILKEFASLLLTGSWKFLIRKVCFECVWMFWMCECECLILFFPKMIGLWSQVNNLYLISWSPTLMNSHTSSEGTEAPIIYFVHLSFFWVCFVSVFLVGVSICVFCLLLSFCVNFGCVSVRMAKLVHWSFIHQGNNLSEKVETLGKNCARIGDFKTEDTIRS